MIWSKWALSNASAVIDDLRVHTPGARCEDLDTRPGTLLPDTHPQYLATTVVTQPRAGPSNCSDPRRRRPTSVAITRPDPESSFPMYPENLPTTVDVNTVVTQPRTCPPFHRWSTASGSLVRATTWSGRSLADIFGFNEPDHSGSWLKPEDAAARWPAMEQVADALNLTVVAPCVSSYSSGQWWLGQFSAAFKNATGHPPRMDHMCVHAYTYSAENVNATVNASKDLPTMRPGGRCPNPHPP